MLDEKKTKSERSYSEMFEKSTVTGGRLAAAWRLVLGMNVRKVWLSWVGGVMGMF